MPGRNEGEVSGSSTTNILSGTVSHSVYGGGNAAGVGGDSFVEADNVTINESIFGGGNEGTVAGDTEVIIDGSTIKGSAYAGGNGNTATVYGSTEILVEGNTVVGIESCIVPSSCSVFGGGNAAYTGSESVNNSSAVVNIAGGTIYGNVYGGANTSKVYGGTEVNIGSSAVGSDIAREDILIKGTVFGGGEANASGSDTYDYTFISVTKGINVNIDGEDYDNLDILGSIFGSGNASSASGTSEIRIYNYGEFGNPKDNISIQRTNLLVIDNSAILLRGATDRTNEYSNVLFTLSLIDNLILLFPFTFFPFFLNVYNIYKSKKHKTMDSIINKNLCVFFISTFIIYLKKKKKKQL